MYDLGIVYVVFFVFLKGLNVHYDQVAWGSLENLTGRETPATVHQTPPSLTAAMMDLEDWCLLQVRKYDFSYVKPKKIEWGSVNEISVHFCVCNIAYR